MVARRELDARPTALEEGRVLGRLGVGLELLPRVDRVDVEVPVEWGEERGSARSRTGVSEERERGRDALLVDVPGLGRVDHADLLCRKVKSGSGRCCRARRER